MKTEEPTERRLRKAREQGDSPVSRALAESAGLVAAVVLAPGALAATAARAAELLRQAATGHAALSAPAVALEVLGLSAPLLLAVGLVGSAVGLLQTGGIVAGERLAPRLDRLDPIEGLKGLFRPQRVFALVRALAAATAVTALTCSLLREHAADFARSAGNTLAIAPLFSALGRHLGWGAALVAVVLSLVDVAVSRRAFRERNRMTKEEVRREHREAEGYSEVKAKRRRAHQEALTGSILNAVREATVVVVNPTHLASALRYVEGEDEAPKVVALGQGELARRIVEAAHAYGVPCIQDVPIARALQELEIGEEIPEALYEAVAEILREVFENRGKAP